MPGFSFKKSSDFLVFIREYNTFAERSRRVRASHEVYAPLFWFMWESSKFLPFFKIAMGSIMLQLELEFNLRVRERRGEEER